jgi:hypothetical protein
VRRHLASFVLALALVTPVAVGTSLAVAPVAGANSCSLRAYAGLSGGTVIGQGYISCSSSESDFTAVTHIQVCTAQFFGNCVTWADATSAWVNYTPCYLPGILYSWWVPAHYYSAVHQHLYKTAVDFYHSGWNYLGTAYSGNLWYT